METMGREIIRRLLRSRWWQVALAALAVPLLVYAFSTGPPSEHTGGFNEPTCNECHVGTPLNGGAGSVVITAPSTYASGQTYPITVRVSDPNTTQRRWGFELSARTQNGQQAGSLVPTNNQTQLLPTFNGIQYISHTSLGTRAGTTQGVNFTFNWQAPNVTAGPVVFHAAGNAANNSGTEVGDHIYTTSATVQPEVLGPPPDVLEGGIVEAATFKLHPNPVAPGSIVAIFGTNLTNGSSADHSAFGADGKLLTELAGAQVTFNGFRAPLYAAFAGALSQLNVQVPFEVAGAASASVQVTVAGQSSVPRTVFLDAVSPNIFMVLAAGPTQGAILNASDAALAAPAGSIPGARPARRGQDILVIFCNGLGAVTPPLATGAPANSHTTVQPVTVLIDGVNVTPDFAGLTPTLVGLYQVNVRLPASTRTGNDISVVLQIGVKQSNLATIAVLP